MTRIHRLFVAVLDEEDRPMREIARPIEQVPDLHPRILHHDWRDAAWQGGPPSSLPEMTTSQFQAWFSALRMEPDDQPPLSVQTAISLINLARPGTPGRDWLLKNVVPALRDGRLYEAQAIIAEKPSVGGEERPVLTSLVFDIVNDVLARQERAGPCSPEISPDAE